MKLSVLIGDLEGARLVGGEAAGAIEVGGVRDDSRAVEPGDVFVAVPGLRVDGHDFVPQAVARGAAVLVVEREVAADLAGGRPQVVVADAAEALGVLSARAAGRPADRMTLVGVTGTNGKTTSTYLMEAVLAAAGRRPGVIGTVSYRHGGRSFPAPYTTPPPAELQRVFGEMAAGGTTHVVMEVSSAALSMGRMGGVQVQVAAFTNLTQDHLDLHGDMDAYRAAKALLFSRHLAPGGVCVVNADDPAGEGMAAAARAAAGPARRVIRYSRRGAAGAEVRPVEFSSSIDGIRARIATPRGELALASRALLGDYNLDNLLLAVAVAEALELPHEAVVAGVSAMPGVPGRVERVRNVAGLDIVVDYAHTPDALENVLGALRPLTRRRLICVFGCGGDRDPGKRPLMGRAVAERADLAVVTSDNPRTEDPLAIIEMILPAVPAPFYVDADRRTAIRAAVAEATPGDVVLIAGKGHEDYQILGTEKVHFDDREEAAEAARLRQGFTVDEVVRASGVRVVQAGAAGEPAGGFARVIFDGRIAAPGDLYVAIRGQTHDGHAFCAQAVAAGARGVLVADDAAEAIQGSLGEGPVILAAADPRAALGQVARFHRRRWGGKLVGVTGSTGKTTTKDLTRAALGAAGRVHAVSGSLNNETGVPLVLLGLRPYHDYAVVEMGMRGLGEIAYLAGLAEPDVGVVVNAGVAHVGVVGSVEAIARGKGEMFQNLPPDGCAVLPDGDRRLAGHAAAAPRRLTFGESGQADVRLVAARPLGPTGQEIEVEAGGARARARVPLVGHHVAIDACCALAAALALGIPLEALAHGLSEARPPRLRGEISEVAGRRLYVDCYNANPTSMAAALRTVAELRDAGGGGGAGAGPRAGAGASAPRALAVLGDMLELGDDAPAAHRNAGRLAATLGLAVIALGDFAGELTCGARSVGGEASSAADPAGAARQALAASAPGDWILIKASRGMRLERVVAELAALSATPATSEEGPV